MRRQPCPREGVLGRVGCDCSIPATKPTKPVSVRPCSIVEAMAHTRWEMAVYTNIWHPLWSFRADDAQVAHRVATWEYKRWVADPHREPKDGFLPHAELIFSLYT